jgi:hypothetical protein
VVNLSACQRILKHAYPRSCHPQILFVSLKGDALAFLTGVWATGGKEDFKESGSIALLHAAAFLEAHILEDHGIDFPTALPTLLVALESPDQQVCQGLSSVFLASGYRRVASYHRSAGLMPSMATATVSTFSTFVLLVNFYHPRAFVRNVAIFGSGRPQKISRRSHRASRPLREEAPTGKIIEWLVRRFRCVSLFSMRGGTHGRIF